ncbi:hypothetical protein P879_11728 [Paragonimus westermani]|uniref:Uncharacterized protein n=1 Tax=Paragonimus westermani TaxID=34504 RepID=A0A8T0D6X3_9TREM|nr:hypothetical protein P879_11728 [Paragonimus westermani]
MATTVGGTVEFKTSYTNHQHHRISSGSEQAVQADLQKRAVEGCRKCRLLDYFRRTRPWVGQGGW